MAGWRGFAPAMGGPKVVDLARAGVGAAAGLLAVGLIMQSLGLGWLLAPLGASAVLVFAVPNSPLAQPWSVVVGNAASALIGYSAVTLLPGVPWIAPLAVGLAIMTMFGLRALHPPGGALALLVAIGGPSHGAHVMAEAALSSAFLVAGGVVWHRLTARHYPFRQPQAAGAHGTRDPAPEARLGLDPADLAAILQDYNQSANLGVADLARLIGAAEQSAAARQMEGFTCADVMSRDLVTVRPEASLGHVADLFRARGFTSLPVVGADGQFLGMIFQLDLIRRAREEAFRQHKSLFAALVRLIGDHRRMRPVAGDIMHKSARRVAPGTPVGALMPLLADGGAEAVPVVTGAAIIGIVTRTDLVSALVQRLALVQAG